MNPKQLAIIWARRRLVLGTCLLAVLAALVASLVMPRQYTASASIVVDIKSDPISGMSLPDTSSASNMANQIEIMRSDRVAQRVVRALPRDRLRAAHERWRRDADGKPPFEQHYGSLLRRDLSARVQPGSNIIVIGYTGSDPEMTAELANAFAKAYIETTVEMRVEPAREYAGWFDERLSSLRDALATAQRRLSDYQREKGIVAFDERYDQEMTRLSALSEKLAAVQSERVETASRERNTGSALSPDVIDNKVIQNIKSELLRIEAQLAQIAAEVGPSHPRRQQLEAQAAGLRQQIEAETRIVSGAAALASKVSAEQEAALRALVDAQKKRVLELLPEHDEISVLMKDVESAKRAYDAVARRRDQINLESKSEQANVHILNPASVPDTASRPKPLANLLAALFGGLGLGVILALGLESLDRRVRSITDLTEVDDIPVLGVLRPSPPRLVPAAHLPSLPYKASGSA